jgi:predicted Zn-dependent peptidase
MMPKLNATILFMRPFHNSSIRHSGLDPESRKYLKILDSGFRRNDKMAGLMPLCKGFFISLIILILIAQSGIAADGDLEGRVRKHTLANGIRVLLLERPLSPTVSLYIRQRAGAVDEVGGKSGTAHMLEHMMFKGTRTIGTRNYKKEHEILKNIERTGSQLDLERRKAGGADTHTLEALKAKLQALQEEHKKWVIPNELDRIYTENGAESMNAGTGQDLTTYYVSLPSNKIELWARIESDRLQNPVFREFYTERDVVMEERRQRIETNPGGKLAEQFFAAAFQAHPYGNPILGWPSDMRFLGMDDVSSFFRRSTAPHHTVIAVVGAIETQETLALIRKYFGKIPARKPDSPFITEEPPQSGERRVEVIFDAKPQFMIGYHKPPPPHSDDYTLDVLEAVLSGGRTSRFYRTMVEGLKIAESVETANGMPGARFSNLFMIYATPRHPHECRELERAIDAEIEKIKREPVPEQELQKVKNQMKADFIRRLNSNSALASMLSYYEVLLGDYRYLTNYIGRIDKITAAMITEAAHKYLNRENRTVATLVSKGAPAAKTAETVERSSPYEK